MTGIEKSLAMKIKTTFRYVLTAGHCVPTSNLEIEVTLGINYHFIVRIPDLLSQVNMILHREKMSLS